jgi:alpha-tubulin suppressor-like RCC1 family protein
LISLQPQSRRVLLGRDVQFSVQAQGIDVGYQWLFNGAPLSGATTSSWSISNVGFDRAGLYSVILSNAYGSVTSSSARLDVDQIVAWGGGSNGETNVPTGLTNIVAVAAGGSHCLALRENGTITGWGVGTSNTGFFLEYGQAISPLGLTNAIAIAAGNLHSVA